MNEYTGGAKSLLFPRSNSDDEGEVFVDNVFMTREGGVATISLNRPDKLNAMTPGMARQLFDLVQEANTDSSIRVVILRGEGERAFCAGSDISSFTLGGQWPSAMDYHNRDVREDYAHTIRICVKPIIAMVHGYCLGGGLDMAVNSDIRIASDDAQFGAPEIIRGWFGSGAKAQLLPRIVGLGEASRLMLSGESIGANEAYRIGLVQELVPIADLAARTHEVAQQIASRNPIASQTTKLALRASAEMSLFAADMYENELVTLSFQAEEKDQNIAEFLSQRADSSTSLEA